MNTTRFIALSTAIVGLLATGAAQAQFTIKDPKIPKITKEKPPTNTPSASIPAANGPNGQSWFSAIGTFRQGYDPNLAVAPDRAELITPYLDCYAKKHNIDPDRTGRHRPRFYANAYERKKILKDELTKLAELEREFKAMFPSRPNTGKGFDENPAIWDDILTNREPYYQCAVGDMSDPNDCGRLSDIDKARLDFTKENLQKTLDQARSFTPDRGWYVQDFNDRRNEYLRAAISPAERKEFAEKMGGRFSCVSGLLDEIAAAAKKTLPLYRPNGYTLRNPAEERLMRGQVSDLSRAIVLKIGLSSTTWNIQKNSFGIPEKRYKHGLIWAKYPTSISDDGYCRIIYVNIIQDYSGGGTWGSSYGAFIKSEPAGCPAGK